MTDRDLALMVVHELEAKALDGAGYSLRREQAEAIRRLMAKAEGGPIAPTVHAAIGALVRMTTEQLEQVRRAAVEALAEGFGK